ncbi:MAG: ribosomal RNA small subunit methyltransferase A [Sedimentisphaerales bacterium]|nr:ribosomal RNA small subunit methyltransferase A [Sedimentisphaerales bacterium]
MQTKRQIAQLLASAGVSPNRRLGQHFLVDLNLMRLLLDSAQPGPGEVVLEVGCGTGSLTEALAERAGAVVAVEIDRTLASIVSSRLADRDNVELVTGDVLSSKGTMNPAVVEAVRRARAGRDGRLLLVANLPYDVACPVIVHLVKGPLVADAMFVTVQKEVAERMTAAPGGRHYGSVSILLGATGHAHTLRTLGPGVFWPPPKVDSALVAFTRDQARCRRITDMELLNNVIGCFIGHRRKMLRACVKSIPPERGDRRRWMAIFERCGIDPTQRPAELAPEQYVELANLCGGGTGWA